MKLSLSKLLWCCRHISAAAAWALHGAAHDVHTAHGEHDKMSSLLFPTVASGKTDQPTMATVLHVHQEFAALRPLPFKESLLRLMMHGAHDAWQRHTDMAAWRYAATAPYLAIVLLGTSITGGGGAAETTDLQIRSSNASIKRGPSFSASWGRHFVDFLSRQLLRHGLLATLNVSIIFKNAASPVRYSYCTSFSVPSAARVVVIETAAHLFSSQSLSQDLTRLITAVRRIAPKAAIVLVEWPNILNVGSSMDKASASLLAAYSRAAQQLKIDLFRGDIFLNKLSHKCPDVHITAGVADGRPCYWQLFADRAKDQTHPNPWGHQLIGGLVAHHVLQSLVSATEKQQTPAQQPSPDASSIHSMASDELCYQTASSLPIAANGTYGEWRLVDEGAAKGVQKLGLLSTKLNDLLSLDVTRDLPNRSNLSCGLLSVSLNYLFSTTIPTQGALLLACRGCICSPYPTRFPSLFPFPVVETNANYASNAQFRGFNVSVSAQTTFIALHNSNKTCYLDIRHIPSASCQTAAGRPVTVFPESRVRVDALFVESLFHSSLLGHILHARATSPVNALVRRAQRMHCGM